MTPASAQRTSAPSRRSPTRWLPLLLVLGCVAGQTALLTHFGRRLWFVGGDDWDFLLERGTVPGVDRGWFAPHHEHWSTGVILVMRTLFHFYGLRTYLPYVLVVIVLHALISLTVYALLRSVGAGRWVAASATLVVVFLGAGAQAFLWDSTMNLLASVWLGLCAVLVVQAFGAGGRPLVVTWVLLVVALTFSGAGVTVVLLAAVFAAGRYGGRAALLVLSVPAAVYLVWFAAIGHTGLRSGTAGSAWDYTHVPAIVWDGFTKPLDAASAISGGGGIILMALGLGPLLARSGPPALRQLALAGICAGLFQLTTSGALRLNNTEGQERYGYLAIVLLVPALAYCVSAGAAAAPTPRWVAGLIGAWVLVAYCVTGVSLEHAYYTHQRAFTDPWPGTVRGILAATDAGERVLTEDTEEWINDGFRPSLVGSREIRAKMPEGEATAAERLEAERQFYVGVGRESFGLLRPADVTLIYFNEQIREGSGCGTYQASVETPVITLELGDTGNEIGVDSASTSVTTYLTRGGEQSEPRQWDLDAGTPVYIGSSARDAQLVLTFDRGGSYTVCTG